MNNQGPIAKPDLRSILDYERSISASRFNCVRIGRVIEWDADSQSAKIGLVNAAAVYNTPPQGTAVPATPQVVPFPTLVQVPVLVISGGGAFLGMPVAAGDFAIVLFHDRDLDPWWTNGTTGAVPNSNRMHSLADGIAIVGLRPATSPIAGLPTDGQHVTFGNAATTMFAILNLAAVAMTALNAKTGPDASAEIAAFQTAAGEMFQ